MRFEALGGGLGGRAIAGQRTSAHADFDRIYRSERTRVASIVRGVIGPSDELEDVVQQVFVEIYRCLPGFEGRAKVSTWVYRIAVNVALQYIRRRKRLRWLKLGATGEEPERLRAGSDQVRRIEGRQLLEQVYAAAETLSDKKRTVWVLHELEGMEPREVAEVLEIPMNTVRSRLLAARRGVMAELERRGIVSIGGEARRGR